MGCQTNVGYQCHAVILHKYSTVVSHFWYKLAKRIIWYKKHHYLACGCGQPYLDVTGYQQESVMIMKCGVLSLQHLRKYNLAIMLL